MAFTVIVETSPQGTDRGKILDENIREFKNAVARDFEQISGYPDCTALVTQSWTTDGRPTAGLKAGLFGWNTIVNSWDRYSGTGWEFFGQTMPSWATLGRPASPYTGQYGYNTDLAVIECWSGTAWVRVAGGRRGDIKMWSGAVDDIETGWALCDGVERTHPEGGTYTPPNLRDKFIVGAGSTYAVAATGGEAAHVLTVTEMPSHTHGAYQGYPYSSYYPNPGSMLGQGVNAPVPTTSTGGDQAHNNLPPYYALCYLYKL